MKPTQRGQASIEDLEGRRLFASLWGTQLTPDRYLTLKGTSRSDFMSINVDPNPGGFAASVTVSGNGFSKIFSNITGMSILTRSGDDTVTVTGPDMSDCDFSLFIYTANGDDTVYVRNYSGRVTVDGGMGDDRLSAKKAFLQSGIIGPYSGITLEGGDGDDILVGSDADDRLDGGWDDDTLLGNAGDDSLDPGFGSNVVYAGDGDDTIFLRYLPWDVESQTVDGGTGDDLIFRTIPAGVDFDEIEDQIFGVEDVFNQTEEIGKGGGEDDEDEFYIPSGKG